MIIGWQAWFVDSAPTRQIKRYKSTEIEFEDLPDDGCLGFVVYYDSIKPDGNPRRLILKSEDYYFLVEDTPCGNRDSFAENEARYDSRIIRGMWSSDSMMEQVDMEMREAVSWL